MITMEDDFNSMKSAIGRVRYNRAVEITRLRRVNAVLVEALSGALAWIENMGVTDATIDAMPNNFGGRNQIRIALKLAESDGEGGSN